jgi:hypothetical protein
MKTHKARRGYQPRRAYLLGGDSVDEKKARRFCTCEKEAGFDICDKCRERANDPDNPLSDEALKQHFEHEGAKLGEALKHFGHIEGCEPLLCFAVDDTDFDTVDNALKTGGIPPYTNSRILNIGRRSINMRPHIDKPRTRIIIDIDPACPLVLVRTIINESPTVIDLDDTNGCGMTAEEEKAFAEKILAYAEHDHETRTIKITIPENAPLSLTDRQRAEIIKNCLDTLLCTPAESQQSDS